MCKTTSRVLGKNDALWLFKKKYGMYPKDWRRKYMAKEAING